MPIRLPPLPTFYTHIRRFATRRRPKQCHQHTSENANPSSTPDIHDPYARPWYREPILIGLAQLALFSHVFSNYCYSAEGTSGPSMLPTLALEGDWVVTSKLYRRGRGIVVGDIVDLKSPWEQGHSIIKRIVGMPGDFVKYEYTPSLAWEEDTKDGEEARREMFGWEERATQIEEKRMLQVPEGHCWIVGDNLPWSRDSRLYGPVPLALINGKVIARILPFRERRWFENPVTKVGENS